MHTRIFIDTSNDDNAVVNTFEIEIEEMNNIYPTSLKSYSYSLYQDSEEPLLTGEIHHHDERAGPIQLARRVINAIKI